jgi:hypothetical protein
VRISTDIGILISCYITGTDSNSTVMKKYHNLWLHLGFSDFSSLKMVSPILGLHPRCRPRPWYFHMTDSSLYYTTCPFNSSLVNITMGIKKECQTIMYIAWTIFHASLNLIWKGFIFCLLMLFFINRGKVAVTARELYLIINMVV